jgi:hypothetical protein
MGNISFWEMASMSKHLIFIVALISVVASGCATSNTLTRTILDDSYNVIRLEAWLDNSRKPVHPGFEHPAEIGAADMARILESIRIVQPPSVLSRLILKAKAEAEPAFTTEEANSFAKPLAAALRTAAPDERVVFFLHHQRSVYKGTTSSGIAFVKDKRLNIILGRYLMGNQPGYPDIPVGGNPFPTTTDQDFFIATGPFQTLRVDKKAPGGRESVSPQRWLSIDYVSLLNPPAQTAAPTPALPSMEPEKTELTPGAPTLTLEEKLKTLNRLKEEGLITEEEFNEKKTELLKAF